MRNLIVTSSLLLAAGAAAEVHIPEPMAFDPVRGLGADIWGLTALYLTGPAFKEVDSVMMMFDFRSEVGESAFYLYSGRGF